MVPRDDCRGEVIARDDASDPAYADNWQGLEGSVPGETGSDNGGLGFLPWEFRGSYWEASDSPYSQGHFIDTRPSTFNNLGAPAFAMTNGNGAFAGYTASARRPLAQPLAVGQRLSVDIDNPVMNSLAEGDSTGFIVQLQTAENLDGDGRLDERFAFYATQGFNNDEWSITDSRGGETSSGLTDVAGSAGFRLAFTLTGDETYSLTITPSGGGSALSFSGALKNAGKGRIDRVRFVMYGNGSGDGATSPTGEREFYFNHLLIETVDQGPLFRRGDCNGDGVVGGNVTDPVFYLNWAFGAGPTPTCRAACDANGDGSIGGNVTDAVYYLNWAFLDGPPPPQPFPDCGVGGAPEQLLGCETAPPGCP